MTLLGAGGGGGLLVVVWASWCCPVGPPGAPGWGMLVLVGAFGGGVLELLMGVSWFWWWGPPGAPGGASWCSWLGLLVLVMGNFWGGLLGISWCWFGPPGWWWELPGSGVTLNQDKVEGPFPCSINVRNAEGVILKVSDDQGPAAAPRPGLRVERSIHMLSGFTPNAQ